MLKYVARTVILTKKVRAPFKNLRINTTNVGLLRSFNQHYAWLGQSCATVPLRLPAHQRVKLAVQNDNLSSFVFFGCQFVFPTRGGYKEMSSILADQQCPRI